MRAAIRGIEGEEVDEDSGGWRSWLGNLFFVIFYYFEELPAINNIINQSIIIHNN